ncbi:Ger(x)C family spore germination protein [Oceanobacillus salinisoli]|uniref:Ger(x)C family spore germination protein n=1 Tax=Oceanobacillus salinisoli TaxID=2678611 RepID=UPI0012E15442|nr:Ger(x)C family spore germination protein [Oceanobacillus salinisoli]
MIVRVIVSILIPLFLGGCWDRHEIEDLSTVLGLAIDIAEEEEDSSPNHPDSLNTPTSEIGMIKVTAQLAIPGKVPLNPTGGNEGTPTESVWVVEAVGHTMGDAMENLQQKLAHQIFLGHLKVIIISEDVAQKGIHDIMEYLRRVPDVRRTAWIAVNGDDAAQTMEAAPEMERVPSMYLSTVFKEAVGLGKFPEHNLGIFWIAESDKGRDGLMPYITVEKGQHIKIEGIAYFNGSKMAGRTAPYQIALYNGLTEHNPGGSNALINWKENKGILVKSINRETKYRFQMENGKPSVQIDVQIEAEIREKTAKNVNLDDSKIIKEIEEKINQYLKDEYIKLIEQTQEAKSDIFGFGEYVRGEFPDYWDKHVHTSENWKEVYKDLDVDVGVDTKILRTGLKNR